MVYTTADPRVPAWKQACACKRLRIGRGGGRPYESFCGTQVHTQGIKGSLTGEEIIYAEDSGAHRTCAEAHARRKRQDAE